MGKWLLVTASILLSFGAIMQSLSFFNLIPHTLVYSILLISAVILSPWVPPLLLFFSFYSRLGKDLSKGTELVICIIIVVSVYALFLSPLMPWFSDGTYPYLGMIGFVFPFVVSAAVLFLIRGIYTKGQKNEIVYGQ